MTSDRPAHHPDCQCGGAGEIPTTSGHLGHKPGAIRTYTGLAPCPGPALTDDQWAAHIATEIAAGRRTVTDGGVLNQTAGRDAIARIRSRHNLHTTRPTPTEETP